ncbi:hypothetical protein KTR66_21540 [Roseococcus sp. SDR]|uniref:hypothetical protein n=1 Tax=Roseococcus sp. SDR TaxID=2835532 RepID=UPI001BCFFE1C|nr:hypothetical protein [Roseococcus sp. SDR]MBS7792590.1 hypothetical protein [Roseococcus sp. SDR]MBV1847904.1 hypothetical protein [Roseococcus sp. SDR]
MRDLIDELAGIAPGSRLDGLRALRPDVRGSLAGYEAAIFAGASGLSTGERHAVARHVAELNAEGALAAHHAARAGDSARLPTLLDYATLITRTPDRASPEAIETLMQAGLAPRDVVMLGQLIAHVNMQARLLAGLRLLEDV